MSVTENSSISDLMEAIGAKISGIKAKVANLPNDAIVDVKIEEAMVQAQTYLSQANKVISENVLEKPKT